MIDLPPPAPVEVVDHPVIERSCPHGAAWKRPTRDRTGQVLGQAHMGVCMSSLIAGLSLVLRRPLRRIQAYLCHGHPLTISVGEIAERLRPPATASHAAGGRDQRAGPHQPDPEWR